MSQNLSYPRINVVDADGNLVSFAGGGTGGSGDASASNQSAQITLETAIRDRLPSALVGDRLKTDSSGVTQPVSVSSLPLPSGAATDVTLQQVRDAIKAQIDIASTIWTDNSGAFYVRRDLINEGTGTITVSFTDPSGTTATPGTGLRPLSTTDKDTITDFYDVLTSGTGYSVGDLLSRVGILDVNSSTPSVTAIWLNLTLGTILGTSPTSANIERANENVGARQVGTWNVTATLDTTNSGYLSNLNTAVGSAITGATMPSGGAGWFGWLSAIWLLISNKIPTLTLVGSALKVDGSGITQPVSLSSVPLASNAATDTTLQQVRDAIKAQIDIASTIWTDNSGAFYVRRDLINEGTGTITVSFTDPSGTTATPGTGLRPLSTTDKDTITDFYDVLTSGTGYSVGDLLSRVGILDVNSSTPSVTAIWLNLTLGTILGTSPTSANIERANENVGARQVGTWNVTATLDTTNSGYLSSLNSKTPPLGANTASNSQPVTLANDGVFATNFGAASDSTAATDTGTFSLIALFKRLLSSALAKGQAVMASSISVTIASNQTAIPVTLPSTQIPASYTPTTTSGTVAAGKYAVSFYNFGSSAGILLGNSFPAGATISYTPPPGMTLSAIAYDATGTTFLIGSL